MNTGDSTQADRWLQSVIRGPRPMGGGRELRPTRDGSEDKVGAGCGVGGEDPRRGCHHADVGARRVRGADAYGYPAISLLKRMLISGHRMPPRIPGALSPKTLASTLAA